MEARHGDASPRVVGRYLLFDEVASGGMATVHLGRLLGPAGFARTVAIKRMHPQFAKEPEFVSMFMNEARLASRIQHPNVVSTLDVIAQDGELLLVMEYVPGESLSKLLRVAAQQGGHAGGLLDPGLIGTIMAGALHGLHAAHEARDVSGEALGMVHRDVSPQNILIGVDGVARVLDFGVAKAASRLHTTRDGQLKGKLAYMAPEQLSGGPVDRRADVFAAGIVHWEALTGRRLFPGNDVGEVMGRILSGTIQPPSAMVPELAEDLDDVVMRALERDPARRYATARAYAIAVESAAPMMLPREVGEWAAQIAATTLGDRAAKVAALERQSFEAPAGKRRWPAIAIGLALVAATAAIVAVEARPAPRLATNRAAAGPGEARSPPSRGAAPPAAPVLVVGPSLPAPPLDASAITEEKSHKTIRSGGGHGRPPKKARRRDCEPPYNVDALGIRRVKLGCI
jgi:hypothetical protein